MEDTKEITTGAKIFAGIVFGLALVGLISLVLWIAP